MRLDGGRIGIARVSFSCEVSAGRKATEQKSLLAVSCSCNYRHDEMRNNTIGLQQEDKWTKNFVKKGRCRNSKVDLN